MGREVRRASQICQSDAGHGGAHHCHGTRAWPWGLGVRASECVYALITFGRSVLMTR